MTIRRIVTIALAPTLLVLQVHGAKRQRASQPSTAAPAADTTAAGSPRRDVPTLVDELRPSLVAIVALGAGADGKRVALVNGSGFVVGPGGAVVTAHHVVRDIPPEALYCIGVDGRAERATVERSAPAFDLALLRVPAMRDAKPVALGTASSARQGDEAIILGYPQGAISLSVSRAMISAFTVVTLKGQPKPVNAIKVDGGINKGHSGGPLVHLPSGTVIGVIDLRVGGVGDELAELSAKRMDARMVLSGVDPTAALQTLITHVDQYMTTGLGYAVDARHASELLAQSARGKAP